MAAAAAVALGSGDKAQRLAAYANLVVLAQDGGDVSALVSCVAPLTALFAHDVSVIDAREFQHAHAALAEVVFAAPLQIGAEYMRQGRFKIAWGATCNAYAEVYSKHPPELTRCDAMTEACNSSVSSIKWARGADAIFDDAGMEKLGWLSSFLACNRLAGTRKRVLPPGFTERLAMLLLDIIRDPQGTSELTLGGAWFSIGIALSGDKDAMASLLRAGLIEVAVKCLRQASPVDWVSWKTRPGIVAAAIANLGWMVSTAQISDLNLPQLLLDQGFIDVAIDMFKAYEMRGAAKVIEANVCGIWGFLQIMTSLSLDLSASEAIPIVEQVRTIPSVLRFILDHPLSHFRDLGFSTESQAAVVCALTFGKDEGGSFEFSESVIESILHCLFSCFSGSMAEFNPDLTPYFLSPVVFLCISDENKKPLLRCPTLLPLLMEAFLLDPGHMRQTQAEAVKAAIQRDAVECFLQLVLFEAGREILGKQSAALHAVRQLATDGAGALTAEVQVAANQVLMVVEGRSHELEPQRDGTAERGVEDARHLMLSYNWSHQDTVVRINASLKVRGYNTWIDIEKMQGSTMDAMAHAVDYAAVMCYTVSLAYKESSNCRLEVR